MSFGVIKVRATFIRMMVMEEKTAQRVRSESACWRGQIYVLSEPSGSEEEQRELEGTR